MFQEHSQLKGFNLFWYLVDTIHFLFLPFRQKQSDISCPEYMWTKTRKSYNYPNDLIPKISLHGKNSLQKYLSIDVNYTYFIPFSSDWALTGYPLHQFLVITSNGRIWWPGLGLLKCFPHSPVYDLTQMLHHFLMVKVYVKATSWSYEMIFITMK